MKEWIISIAGIICLGILLEIVLPDGKSAKYIKGAFSLVVVLAIAAPLPSLLKKDFQAKIDTDYFAIEKSEETFSYSDLFAQKAVNALLEKGCAASVEIVTDDGVVSEIRVTVNDMVLQGSEIVNVVSSTLNVAENKVKVIYDFFAENRACARARARKI